MSVALRERRHGSHAQAENTSGVFATVNHVPQIDTGPTDGPPGPAVKTAWVTLTVPEAQELLETLQIWAEEVADGHLDPQWHAHLTDDDGNELTIAITPDAD